MKLPSVAPAVSLSIYDDYNLRHGVGFVRAQLAVNGETFCQQFEVRSGAPDGYAKAKLDELALAVGRRLVFGK